MEDVTSKEVKEKKIEKTNEFWSTLKTIFWAFILALLLRAFVFEPFYIPSASMEPTLYPNDRILVSKLDYLFSPPGRGDVIVFKYPMDPSVDYIKRIIALPGEKIEIKNGVVFINGKALEEDYIMQHQGYDFGPLQVPQGMYFVMGDNRNDSADSRYWGPLAENLIIGEAKLIYWPPSRIRLIK